MNNNNDVIVQIIDWHSDNYDKRELTADINSDRSDDDISDSEDYIDNYSDSDLEYEHNESPKKESDEKYKIFIFGKDKKENTYCIEVNEFTPYFYIRVPDHCKERHRELIEKYVRDNMWAKYRSGFLRTSLLKKHSFRNFELDSDKPREDGLPVDQKWYKFIRLVFSNTYSMKAAIRLFQITNKTTKKTGPKKIYIEGVTEKEYQYDLYENMIDPLIKFIHHRDISPVGWIRIPKNKYNFYNENASTCKYMIKCRWKDILSLNDESNSKIKVMAYDIECNSSHGDFPLAKKDYLKLVREIHSNYQEIPKLIEKLKNNNSIIDILRQYLNNQYCYISDMIKQAFELKQVYTYTNDMGKDQILLPINRVYTKNKIKPSQSNILKVAKECNEFVYLTTKSNVNDKKKEFTECIDKMLAVFNSILPAVEGDQTIQIGASFIKYGTATPYRNIMLTLGSCDKLNNAETYCFNNERDLLLKFLHIITEEEDPEIVTGYNIDGFDTIWLFKRAEELGIIDDFNKLSRIKQFSCEIQVKQVKGYSGELMKKEYVTMPGRIQMDIMPLVQKNYQLASYSLDFVSSNFINGPIYSTNYDEVTGLTEINTKSTVGLNVGNFIVINIIDGYLQTLYNEGEKFEIKSVNIKKGNDGKKIHTLTFNANLNLPKDKELQWCLGKDDIKPNDIFRLQKGSSNDRYIIAKYCLMDVILCIELLNKLDFITFYIGMANVCYNPLSWIIHRGQGIRSTSLVGYFIKDRDYLLPYLYKNNDNKEGYEGAVVLDPVLDIYIDDPIGVLDYGSLYPSSMREKNISSETICINPKYCGEDGAKLLNKLGYDYEDITYDTYKPIFTPTGQLKGRIKSGKKTNRYVQYRIETTLTMKNGKIYNGFYNKEIGTISTENGIYNVDPLLIESKSEKLPKGIIPQLLEYLINNRKSTRKRITSKAVTIETGEIYIGVYNAEKEIIVTEKGEKIDLKGKTIKSVLDAYDDFQKKTLDGRQNAFKITANAMYGQFGATTSDIYYNDIAASTTATGRERLELAQKYVENELNYPQKLKDGSIIYLKNTIVYGDTDSVFVKFQCLDDEGRPMKGRDARVRCMHLAMDTQNKIQRQLRDPQVLEYDKTFHPFILLSKKRYVGNLYEENPDEYEVKSMGIALKRRDYAPIVKIVYGGIIDIIMREADISKAISYLKRFLREFADGKYPLETMIISKQLAPYYKNPDQIAHKVLADRIGERDPGNKPQVGDRIQYINIIKEENNGIKLLQGDKIEPPEYVKAKKLQPDYEHYIANQICKPISQIFSLCLDKIPGYNSTVDYKKMYRDHLEKTNSTSKSIKYVSEQKRKVAESLIFSDIYRILNNRKKRQMDITSFFGKK